MKIQRLAMEDSRVDPYRNLRERTLRGEDIFIAEGELVVNRLIESPCEIVSILAIESKIPQISPELPENTPVYLVDDSRMEQITGFRFYQGILALGKRPELPELNAIAPLLQTENVRVVVLPDTTKPDNLGLIFRCCAALHATAVVLGPQCCDPFSRRALRVSMGGVLQLPIVKSPRLERDLERLRKEYALEIWGAVIGNSAENLSRIQPVAKKVALLFGNEFAGLQDPWISLCDRKVMIPMSPKVDSLNLGVSVGIFLYELNRGR